MCRQSATSIFEHLVERNGVRATAWQVKVNRNTVVRYARLAGGVAGISWCSAGRFAGQGGPIAQHGRGAHESNPRRREADGPGESQVHRPRGKRRTTFPPGAQMYPGRSAITAPRAPTAGRRSRPCGGRSRRTIGVAGKGYRGMSGRMGSRLASAGAPGGRLPRALRAREAARVARRRIDVKRAEIATKDDAAPSIVFGTVVSSPRDSRVLHGTGPVVYPSGRAQVRALPQDRIAGPKPWTTSLASAA
jgi:hypothetical protein